MNIKKTQNKPKHNKSRRNPKACRNTWLQGSALTAGFQHLQSVWAMGKLLAHPVPNFVWIEQILVSISFNLLVICNTRTGGFTCGCDQTNIVTKQLHPLWGSKFEFRYLAQNMFVDNPGRLWQDSFLIFPEEVQQWKAWHSHDWSHTAPPTAEAADLLQKALTFS